MKKHVFTLAIACLSLALFAQQMQVKKFNFTSFRSIKKVSSELLAKKSSITAKQHPEYGILPFNSQCAECVELIDKRTIDSRLFIDPKNEGHTYSQQSYFPLHYKKTENDIWRTIDSRLREKTNGVYVAVEQPVPTKCDLNSKSTSLTEKGFEFEFNKNLSLYFFDDNSLYTQKETGNYSNYTVGEEGLKVKNMWRGIDMEQIFTAGQIKTNYIIAAPLQLPVTKGWMVIEDHFTLPQGFTINETEHSDHLPEGYYRGDYVIKNEKSETYITYEKPVYIDAKVLGMHGIYNLLKNGNDYTLQTLIPVEWLNKPDNTYPLMIDPIVSGVTKFGDFRLEGLSANMGFTSMQLGSCDYHMNVNVPGQSQLTDAYVDLEYQLTYDNMCGTPSLPPPFCTFSQVNQEVICNACSTSTGVLACNPAMPPYTGTCTTDPNLVPGANAILVNSSNPSYLSCIPPQCTDYTVSFTLKNRDSICGDVCGYLCARSNMWQMTVEARRVGGNITATKSQVCPGDSVELTAHASSGFPPYTYSWIINGVTLDTIYDNPNYTINPVQDANVYFVITDTCGATFTSSATDAIYISVYSRTAITLSNDTLYSQPRVSYQWYRNDTVLQGDTLQYVIATLPGYYKVEVVDTNGCQSFSDAFAYLISGILNTKEDKLSLTVIPNPSDGNFVLRFKNNMVFSLSIFDVSGKLIDTRSNLTCTDKTYTYHPIKKMTAGVYLVEIKAGDAYFKQRIVVTD